MRAGVLRHHLTINEPDEGFRDDVGQIGSTWTEYATAWGSVEDLTGQELTDARQVNGRASVRVTMRYVSGVTCDMQVVTGSRTLGIVYVADTDGRQQMLTLTCVESR